MTTQGRKEAEIKRLPLLRPSLAEMAYERLEAEIVRCTLRPGAEVTLQDLQKLAGLGRTPVHEAVKRLAADTLLVIKPRAGIQIAPVDLAREGRLLGLRREMERFVVTLAAGAATPIQRSQMMRLARRLREAGETFGIDEFNVYDRQIDKLILSAAGEPFLEHSLRPLHTIFRRSGWLCLTHVSSPDELGGSVDCHVALLDAIVRQDLDGARKASDLVVDMAERLFSRLARGIDPALLDARLEMDL